VQGISIFDCRFAIFDLGFENWIPDKGILGQAGGRISELMDLDASAMLRIALRSSFG
jgi:hypothetical protein